MEHDSYVKSWFNKDFSSQLRRKEYPYPISLY